MIHHKPYPTIKREEILPPPAARVTKGCEGLPELRGPECKLAHSPGVIGLDTYLKAKHNERGSMVEDIIGDHMRKVVKAQDQLFYDALTAKGFIDHSEAWILANISVIRDTERPGFMEAWYKFNTPEAVRIITMTVTFDTPKDLGEFKFGYEVTVNHY